MKKTKIIAVIFLALIFTAGLTGCGSNHGKSSLKDNLIDGWDNWMKKS